LTASLEYALYGGTPPHVQAETSLAAAESMRPSVETLRAKAFKLISRPEGATCDEVEVRYLFTGLPCRVSSVTAETPVTSSAPTSARNVKPSS